MKIKIYENKKENVNESFTLAALAIGALFGFLAKKFFEPAKKQIASAGKEIDVASTELNTALTNDPSPDARPLSLKIVEAKQKLFNDLSEIEKQAQSVKTAAEMPEKPSVMIQKLIQDYENNMEALTVGKKLNPNTSQVLKKARFRIKRALSTINNIDKIMLMSSKKDPNGLWNSVVKNHFDAQSAFMNDEEWSTFIDFMYNKYGKI